MMQALNILLLFTFFTSSFAASTDKMPGINQAFRGYDLLKGDPIPLTERVGVDPGFRQQVLKVSYDNNELIGATSYKEPDNVAAYPCQGSCSFETDVTEVKSSAEYNSMLSKSFTQDHGFALGHIFKSSFSASQSYKYVTKSTDSEDLKFTFASASCCSYTVEQSRFGQDAEITDAFKSEIDELPVDYDEAKYGQVIEIFGTHFITTITMGSMYVKMDAFTDDTWSKFEQENVDISESASKQIFSYKKDSSSTTSSEQDATVNLDAQAEKVSSAAIGAKPPADGTVNTWIQSSVSNPAPIGFKLQTISFLLGSDFQTQYDTPADDLAKKQNNLNNYLNNYCKIISSELAVSCDGPAVQLKRYTGWDVNNVYQTKAGTGGWGGYCTCPDGQKYAVGDNNDKCGSLACVHGAPGTCEKSWGDWSQNRVTCSVAAGHICASENEECWCSGEVRMGSAVASGSTTDWQPSLASVLCAKESFGVDQGFTDAHCWCRTPPAPAQGYWSIGEKCADEGEICYCNGMVRFGARNELSDRKSVSGQVECSTNQFPDVMPGVTKSCFCKSVNKYADNVYQTNAPNIGGWGGYCTCPDGHKYAVGDNGDSCGSLACVGGKPGSCSKTAGEWSNNKVTCGLLKDSSTVVKNVYQTKAGTGYWGGYCTCPDGSRYAVGDNGDSCGSLACVGGKSGQCYKKSGEWSNNKVTCGSVEGSKFAPNVYQKNAPNTGGWGGYCTCPDGQSYAVGDNGDSCGSLACVGGKPGSCSKTAGEWSNNKVTCGSVEDTNMLLVEESLVAEVNETAFVRWLIYGLAIFGCFIVVQKGVSLFQKEQEYNNIDQEC